MKDRVASFLRRNAQTIPLTIIALCVGGILLLQAVTVGQLRETVEQIKANSEKTERRIKQVDKHLDCIVYFFSRTNRDDKAIKNIETCQLEDKPVANFYRDTAPPAVPVQPDTQTPDSQPTTAQTVPEQRTSTPTPPQRPVTPPAPQEPDDEPILGIPIIDGILKGLGI